MRIIDQRTLLKQSGEILHEVEAGQRFGITLKGRLVAELGPIGRSPWVAKSVVLAYLRSQSPDPDFLDDIHEIQGTLEELRDPWAR